MDQNIGPYVVYNVQTVSVKFFSSADPFAKTSQGSVTREFFFLTSDLITA